MLSIYFSRDQHCSSRSSSNASDGFDYLASNEVDVVIAEIDLPDLNGITALKPVKKSYEHSILMFSSQPEEVYAISTLSRCFWIHQQRADLNIVKEAILKVNRLTSATL